MNRYNAIKWNKKVTFIKTKIQILTKFTQLNEIIRCIESSIKIQSNQNLKVNKSP